MNSQTRKETPAEKGMRAARHEGQKISEHARVKKLHAEGKITDMQLEQWEIWNL